MKVVSIKLRVLLIFVLTLFSTVSFSQIDKEFWFSIPYVNKNHGIEIQSVPSMLQSNMGGGKPVYLRLSTLSTPAVVTINCPANLAGLDTVISIAANSSATVDLTAYLTLLEVSQTYSTIINGPENKGIHIVSTASITAYYENATIPSPEILTLKGSNALGKEFYTPFQTNWPNDPLHNYQKKQFYTQVGGWKEIPGKSSVPDSAFSAFDIVATEDGTIVTITPTTDVVGHKKGETFDVVLKKGQTYSVRQLDQAITDTLDFGPSKNDENKLVYRVVGTNREDNNLSGSHVISNKPIAISVKDDSIFPNDITESGDCEDFIGDQLIPVNLIGKEYVVMKGALAKTNSKGDELTDYVYIVGVKDGTKLTVDGVNLVTIKAGETFKLPVMNPYMHITSSENIYAFHISGYNCELASAVLPPINNCSGSNEVGFVRTYADWNQEKMFINVLVRKGGEKAFKSDPDNNKIANIINNASFISLANSEWGIAQVAFTNAEMPKNAYKLYNDSTYFHIGLIYSTAYSWEPIWNDASTNIKEVPSLQGASYGYFSNFSKVLPKAIIGNNSKKVIQVPVGIPVQLIAQGGYKYDWLGAKYNDVTLAYEGMSSPYYLNKTTGYNPIFDGTAPVGRYRFTAEIVPACDNKYVDTVLIEVIPPITFNDVTDSICEDAPAGSGIGVGYNLNNLTDTIVGTIGKSVGYTVSNWFVKKKGGLEILDDAELNTNVTYTNALGTLTNSIINPSIDATNSSAKSIQLDVSGKDINVNGVDIIPNSPLGFTVGSVFSLQIRAQATDQNYISNFNDPAPVKMMIWDGTTKVTVSQDYLNSNWKSFSWQTMTFDFSSFTTITNITKITLQFDNKWSGVLKYQFDNFTRQAIPHNETISPSTKYTVHDNDTVYAIITNPSLPYFSDTAQVVLGVHATGKASKHITVQPMCASSQYGLSCVDLTQYKYAVGGALVAQKDWYLDAAFTQKITPATCVDVPVGPKTYYAKILDKCNTTGATVSFNITALPAVNDTIITICADPSAAGNSATNVKLSFYNDAVQPLGGNAPEWFSDEALTQYIDGTNGITVSDKQVFYAKVSNSLLCTSTAKLQFTILPLAVITMSNPDICKNGGKITLTQPSTYTNGKFAIDNVPITGSVFDPKTKTVGSHLISYEVEINGCKVIATDSIEVFAVPTVSIIAPDTVVTNSNVQLNSTVLGAKLPISYEWSPQSSIKPYNIQNPVMNNIQQDMFVCLYVTDSNKCLSQICKTIYVKNSPLNIEILPTPKTVCLGQPVDLTTIVTGGADPDTYSFEWSSNPVGFTSDLQNPTFTPTVTGDVTFTITVTDGDGTVKTATTNTITVLPQPSVTFSTLTPSVCYNDKLTLAPLSITGDDAGAKYTWTGVPLVSPSPTSGKSITIDATQNPGLPYPVTFTVLNATGCSDSKILSVTINARPTLTIDSIKLCKDLGKTINATVTGGKATYTHKWSGNYNVGDLVGDTNEDPIFKTSTYGLYQFTDLVTDANGCTATASVIGGVTALPEPNILAAYKDSVCQNANDYLLKSEVKGNLDPISTYTFNWSSMDPANPFASSEQNAILNVSKAKTFNLKLQVTDKNGCYAYDSVIVKVNPKPTTQIVGNLGVCQGVDLPLSSFEKSTNFTYTWTGDVTPKTGTDVIFNSNFPALYDVTLQIKNNITGCVADTLKKISVNKKPEVSLKDTAVCLNTTFTINPTYVPNPPYVATWTIDTLKLNNTATLNPTFNADELKDYTLGLTIAENGCSAQASMTISVLDNPKANAGIDILGLNSIPFQLSGSATLGTPAYTYLWSPATYITNSPSDQNPTGVLENPQEFTLTVTDKNGCKSTDVVFVNVTNDKPEVKIDALHICDAQTISLVAHSSGGLGSGYVCKWYKLPDVTNSIFTGDTLSYAVSSESIFRVEMTNAPYAMVFDTAIVYVHTPPTANVFPTNAKVCLGQQLPLNADNPAYTYVWHDGSPLTTTGSTYLFTNSTNPGAVTNITLDISDKYCTSKKVIPVTVEALPTVTIAPQNESICAGASLLLTATVNPSTESYSYAWTESPLSTGSADKSLSTYLFTTTKFGPYNVSVEVTNQTTNCKATVTELVSVKKLPDYSLPKDLTACTGVTLPLDINPLGAQVGLSVTWVNQENLSNVGVTKADFKSDIPGDFIVNYTVSEGSNSCPRTDMVAVKVYPAPKTIMADTIKICAGQETDVEVTVLSSETPSISWSGYVIQNPNNDNIAHFTANTLPSNYTVIATASLNEYCSSSAKTIVVVRPNPVANPGNYPIVPNGAQVDLVGTATLGFGTPTYNGKWTPTENIFSEKIGTKGFEAQTNAIILPTDYYFTVTDSFGCSNTKKITINVKNPILITIPENPNPKEPFDPNSPMLPNDDPTKKLNYTLTDHICEGESITLFTQFLSQPTDSYSYEWSVDNTPGVISTKPNVTVQPQTNNPSGKIVYTLKVKNTTYPTSPAQYKNFTVIIHKNPTAYIELTPSTDLFVMQTIQVKGVPSPNAVDYTHLWSGDSAHLTDPKSQITSFKTPFAGKDSLIYTATDIFGCSATVKTYLTINPLAEIDLDFDPVSMCQTSELLSYKIINPNDPDTYKWTISDPSITILYQNTQNTAVRILWNKPDTFTVTIENVTNIKPKLPKTYTVIIYPHYDFTNTISGPQDVCEYERANYSVDTSKIKSKTITWKVASSNDKIIGVGIGQNINVQWGTAGKDTITVRAMNMYCDDSIKYPVRIHKIPTANFYVRPVDSLIDKNIYVDKLVDFDNKSYLDSIQQIDYKNLQYYWDFVGDGVYVEETFEPKYSYDVTGIYYPTLIAVDTVWGCRNTHIDTLEVKINPKCGIKYPNAFTPEAKVDSKFTYGYSEGIVDKDYNLKIFNRWGQLLWETTNRYEKWDGTYRGALCKQDVYVYHSSATCENGQVLKINGDVTLIK